MLLPSKSNKGNPKKYPSAENESPLVSHGGSGLLEVNQRAPWLLTIELDFLPIISVLEECSYAEPQSKSQQNQLLERTSKISSPWQPLLTHIHTQYENTLTDAHNHTAGCKQSTAHCSDFCIHGNFTGRRGAE